MLERVRQYQEMVNARLNQLTLIEHRVLTFGVGVIAALCLLFPVVVKAFVMVTGVLAAGITVYLICTVCEREKAEEEAE